jgi:hypothetical protein
MSLSSLGSFDRSDDEQEQDRADRSHYEPANQPVGRKTEQAEDPATDD